MQGSSKEHSVEENKSHYEWGSSSHTRTQKSDLTMANVAPSIPIGESVSARSSFKSVQRNRLSFDSAVPKIGRSDGQDFKGPHTVDTAYNAAVGTFRKSRCNPDRSVRGPEHDHGYHRRLER